MGGGALAEPALRDGHPEPIGGREQASVCLAAGVRRGGVGSGSRHRLSRQSIQQQEHCQELPVPGVPANLSWA